MEVRLSDAPRSDEILVAIAVTDSGLLQLLWLWAWAHRSGFRMRLRCPRLTGAVKELGVLILPAVFGAGVYQISRFIDLFFLAIIAMLCGAKIVTD